MKSIITISLAISFLLLSACNTKPSIKSSWYDCIDPKPVVATVKGKKIDWNVVRCDLPKDHEIKKMTVVEDGKEDKFTQWTQPSGKVCNYRDGPYYDYILRKDVIDKDVTHKYGLLPTIPSSWDVKCAVSLGFLPVEGFNIFYMYTNSSRIHGVNPRGDYTLHVFNPTYNDGVIGMSGFLYVEGGGGVWPYKITLRDSNNNILKKWDNIFSVKSEYRVINTQSESVFSAKSDNVLFTIGDSVAFIETKLPIEPFRYYEPRRTHKVRTAPKKLHLINANMQEIKVLDDNEFKIQPMVDNGITNWNIISTLPGEKDLYGFMTPEGKFAPPPGTLGVRPAVMNYEYIERNVFTRKSGEGDLEKFKQPDFWFIAYKDNKGKRIWGSASPDLSQIDPPKWRDVRAMPDDLIFVQRLDNNRWEFMDGQNTGLDGQSFASLNEAHKKVASIINTRFAEREKAGKEMQRKRNIAYEKSRQQRRKLYQQAKRTGDTETMRRTSNLDYELKEDYLLSNYSSIDELEKYVQIQKDLKPLARSRNYKRLADTLSARKKNREDYLKRQEMYLAEQRRQSEISATLQRWADKRQDLENWRSTVNSNVNKLNRAVNQQWQKHQLEMYKEGYISAPK